MLDATLIVMVILGMSTQGLTRKAFSVKYNAPFLFSFLSVGIAMLFFLVSALISETGFILSWDYIPYAIIFALGYGAATVFGFFAIVHGSLGLTSLVSSYSLIIPTIYGILFLGEKPSIMLYIGLALLFVSIFLINFEKGEKKITIKWLIFVTLSLVGNGVCTTAQKVQQMDQNKAYKNEFMTIALLMVTLVCLIFALCYHKKDFKPVFTKPVIILPIVCGGANALVNYLVMVLSRIDASLLFPVISAGGIIATGIISLTIYKERFTKQQIAGMILGIASVVCLNI